MSVSEGLTTVVSTKGQVILPKAIRDTRHWPAGTRLSVENTPDGVLLKPVPVFAQTDIDAVFGSLRREGPPLSLEDMDAAVVREGRRRARN